MITWIDFRSANGSRHPNADELKKSALALLIEECLQRHEAVFGSIKPVDVFLSDDGTLGELHLSPDCMGKWVPITIVPVNLAMFQELPLSAELRRSVVRFFDDFAEKHKRK